MDYSFKLYNINLTFAVNHPVSFAFNAAYFYMQAACVMVIGADSTPCRHYYLSNMQWRNVTIWCPPAHFLPPPTKILVFKKKKKKGRHFFSVFLIGFLPPWSFLYPQKIFSHRPNAKLAEIWYILLLCQKIFRLKNCKFGNMPPPPP